MTKRAKRIGHGLIVLWMFLPIIPALTADLIGFACGCQVDEGSVHSCIVLGLDIGSSLYSMGVIGWLVLITFPTGIVALVVFSLVVRWQSRAAGRDEGL
jgi:hypothetical protein